MKHRVVTRAEIGDAMRFDGGYHNADGNIYHSLISKHSSKKISDFCTHIYTSGRNKRVYTDCSHGFPFLSNADVGSINPFSSCKYSSRKYGFDLDSILTPGMILTGRVGAIGQTAFVPPHWIKFNTMGSDNIIRLSPKPDVYNGFLYAYLTSKMGKLILWKHSTGGVQPFITDTMVGTIPVPDIPHELQDLIDGKIKESANLRAHAAEVLEKVHIRFREELSLKLRSVSNSVNIQNILSSDGKRLEGVMYTDGAKAYLEAITKLFPYKTVGDLTLNIFTEGIFKREYVKKGYPFMMGSEILKAIPTATKFLSYRQAAKKEELFVKEGWLLMTCSGSVGDVVYVDKQLTQFIYTHDLIRIVPRDMDTQLYLFGFLSSPIGKQLVDHFKYGSVIQHLEAFHVAELPVPMLDEYIDEIIANVKTYVDSIYRAKKLELEAISMVEQEIEKWQKN